MSDENKVLTVPLSMSSHKVLEGVATKNGVSKTALARLILAEFLKSPMSKRNDLVTPETLSAPIVLNTEVTG